MSICYISPMKTCTTCGQEKALSEFTPNKRASQGVSNWCRPCYNEYGAAYYAKTRDRRRGQARTIRAANAEKYNAKGKAWRDANPEYYRQRYTANRDEVKAATRRRYWADPAKAVRDAVEWARRNPDKTNARNARRHARKINAPGRGISGTEWEQVMADSLGLCAYCGEPTNRLQLDHVEPLARGGKHDVDNAVAACKSCNCSKRDKPLLVWLAERAVA